MKKILVLLLSLVMIATLAACGNGAPAPAEVADDVEDAVEEVVEDVEEDVEPDEPEEAGTDGPYVIRVTLPPIGNAWHAKMRIVMDDAIAAIEADYPGQFDIQAINALDEADQVDTLILWSEDPTIDLIGIMPQNGTLVTPIAEEIYNSGTPTVIMNRAIESDVFTAFVTGDNNGGGRNAAEFIADFLDGEGDLVVIRSGLGTPIDLDRNGGFMDVIEGFPGINILGEADGGFNRSDGLEAMTNLLAAHENIDAVFAQDDEAGLGALQAIRDAGREDVRIITGFGGVEDVFEIYQMEDPDHIYRATMSYFPTMGEEGLRMAIRILRGESVPKETFQPSHVVTMHNWADHIQFAY